MKTTKPPGNIEESTFMQKSLVLMAAMLSVAAGSQAATPASRDAERCRAHASIDACYDAIRREPRDPVLLVALGDSLAHANRQTEALRAYRHAVALSPSMPGVAAKIRTAEAKTLTKSKAKPIKSTPIALAANDPTVPAASSRRFSNADPVAQSH